MSRFHLSVLLQFSILINATVVHADDPESKTFDSKWDEDFCTSSLGRGNRSF